MFNRHNELRMRVVRGWLKSAYLVAPYSLYKADAMVVSAANVLAAVVRHEISAEAYENKYKRIVC